MNSYIDEIVTSLDKNEPVIVSLDTSGSHTLLDHEFVEKLEKALITYGFVTHKLGYLRIFTKEKRTIRAFLNSISENTVVILDGVFIYGGFGTIIESLKGMKVIFLTAIPREQLKKYGIDKFLQSKLVTRNVKVLSATSVRDVFRTITILHGEGSGFDTGNINKVLAAVKKRSDLKLPIVILTGKLSTAKMFAEIVSNELKERYQIIKGSSHSYTRLPAPILSGVFGVLGFLPHAKTVIVARQVSTPEALEILYRSEGSVIFLYNWLTPKVSKFEEPIKAVESHSIHANEEYSYSSVTTCILLPSGEMKCGEELAKYTRDIIKEDDKKWVHLLSKLGFSEKFIQILENNKATVDALVSIRPKDVLLGIRSYLHISDDLKDFVVADYILRNTMYKHKAFEEYLRFLRVIGFENVLKGLLESSKKYGDIAEYIEEVRYSYGLLELTGIEPSLETIKNVLAYKRKLVRYRYYVSRYPLVLVDADSFATVEEAVKLVDELTYYKFAPIVSKLRLNKFYLQELIKLVKERGLDPRKVDVWIVTDAKYTPREQRELCSLIESLHDNFATVYIQRSRASKREEVMKHRYLVPPRVVFYYWLNQLASNSPYPRNFDVLVLNSVTMMRKAVKSIKVDLDSGSIIVFKSDMRIPSDDIGIALAVKYKKPITCTAVKEPYLDEYMFKCFSKDNHALWVIAHKVSSINRAFEIKEYKHSSIWRFTTFIPATKISEAIELIRSVKAGSSTEIISPKDIELPKYIYDLVLK